MLKEYKLKKTEIPLWLRIILNLIGITILFGTVYFVKYYYIHIYNSELRKTANLVNYATNIIQDELTLYYNKNGYIYKDEFNGTDEFCTTIANKYSLLGGNCKISDDTLYQRNFAFKGTKIEVWGLEKSPTKENNVLIKDFFIDVDGAKGKNEIGIDRIPIRIYASGRLKGLITPVNCNSKQEAEYGFIRSKICPIGLERNFMEENTYFRYNIVQIGSNHGKSKVINRNVSFLRADCVAYGGETYASDDYCEAKAFYWLSACYEDYSCAVAISKEKM